MLQSTLKVQIKGLSEKEVETSRNINGSNALTKQKTKSIFAKFIENFSDPIIRVLLIALFLNVLFSVGRVNWLETGGIVVAILISTFVSTFSEVGSEKAFIKLSQDANSKRSRVFRCGEIFEIPTDEIVVGDVVSISSGEIIPADGKIIDGLLTVDQSALNGESIEIHKKPSKADDMENLSAENALFRGTVALSGEALMKVGVVGDATLYGKIAQQLQTQTRESPLKLRLSKLAGQISKIGYVAAACVALFYLFHFFVMQSGYNWPKMLEKLSTPTILFPTLLHAFTLAITVVVVAVPEGLPMMITVVLSSNMKRMMKDNVLVKKMVGIETAGSMNLLFSDKTGTLTCGRMSISSFLLGDGSVCRTKKEISSIKTVYELLTLNAYYNTESHVSGRKIIGGNNTDRAILSYFSKETNPTATKASHLPFESQNRFEAVHLKNPNVILIKGAPELLLPKVASYYAHDGAKKDIAEEDLLHLKQNWRAASTSGERVIAVCLAESWSTEIEKYSGLTLLSLICLKDKIRPDAKKAVSRLHKAGIRVVMITGDHQDTAIAIANECGIYIPGTNQKAITGADLSSMTDDDIAKLMPQLRVVSRALPTDKTRLVRIAQQQGYVVGMTGDGVNDAPSLKLADVGFAMGEGADIAKEAADIVLLDGHIASVGNTVLYGRTIFHSIRKFITFQLMMNLCAVGVSLFGQYIGIESPITIIQMLWVNIIMDTLGGLAFAGEPPLERYMREPVKSREESILSRAMLHQIFITGGFTLLLCATFLIAPCFRESYLFYESKLTYLTCFFVLFIFCGVANCFNVRSGRLNPLADIRSNPLFILLMVFICFVQTAMVYFGGEVFRTTPLEPSLLFSVIGLAFLVIPFDLVRKIFYKLRRRKTKKSVY